MRINARQETDGSHLPPPLLAEVSGFLFVDRRVLSALVPVSCGILQYPLIEFVRVLYVVECRCGFPKIEFLFSAVVELRQSFNARR